MVLHPLCLFWTQTGPPLVTLTPIVATRLHIQLAILRLGFMHRSNSKVGISVNANTSYGTTRPDRSSRNPHKQQQQKR